MMKNNINTRITEIIKTFNDTRQQIISLYEKGEDLESIALSFSPKKSKQSINEILKYIAKDIHADSEIQAFCDQCFIGESLIYIDCSGISSSYARLFAKIAKLFYPSIRLSSAYFVTTEEKKKGKPHKKLLNDCIEKRGFPFALATPDEYGKIDRETFLVCTAGVEWIFNKEKNKILANPRISFMNNVFFYQRKYTQSIWDVYKNFRENSELQTILNKEDIFSPGDLSSKIAFRQHNYKKLEERFHVSLVVPKKDSPFGFALYEMSALKISPKELIGKVEKLIKSIEAGELPNC